MQPSSACVGPTRSLNAWRASASLPGSALNDPTTTTSDMRCSPPADGAPIVPVEGGAPMGLRINHVSVNAKDLEESTQFYVDLLGAERLTTPNFGIPVQWLALGRTQLHLFERDL